MQEWIGHIAAAVIGATLLLVLAVLSWRGQHHTITATQYSAAKESALDFAEVIDEDLSNMGAGLRNNTIHSPSPPYAGAFYTGGPEAAFDTSSTIRSIHFCSWTDRTATINPLVDTCNRVAYTWQQIGTVQVQSPTTGTFVTVPTYLIERLVNGNPAGQSTGTVTEVRFDLYNASGASTGTLADVRAIEVTLKAVSPLGGGKGIVSNDDPNLKYQIDETRWSRMIRPLNLARISN